jgi:hypothetical protein
MRRIAPISCLAAALGILSSAARADSLRESGFTAMWWAEGPPHYLSMKGPSPPPLLCLRSGQIGVLLDMKSVLLLHAGHFAVEQPKDAALEAGTKPVLELPPVELQLSLSVSGKTFACTGRGLEPKDEFVQPVRFVESGRFFQRVVIDGLQFASAGGSQFDATDNLEIALWPDRLSLSLGLNKAAALRGGELRIAAAGKRASVPLAPSARATVVLFESEPGIPVAELEASPALTVSSDSTLGCQVVYLPEKSWSNAKGTYYPEEHLDRLDRWPLTLINPSERPTVVRLMFTQTRDLPITGFTPMLCDPDGTPSGLPVQISKNWHQRSEKGHLDYEGPWFHGFTFVRLPPKSRRELVFQMAYARYGGVPAASHAQLSLVGWGHNQFWDEAAIGSFGESICYEPGRVQRRCFIDDVRPLTTLPVAGGKPWGWAENCGGGDFLVWVDERGGYRGFRATRTDYRAQGPCLTDVRYLEETTGGEIAARMDVSLARSDDYLRACHHIRYDVRQPVKWQRLALYQLGADFYNDTPARRVAVGDTQGMRAEWTPPQLLGGYDRRSVPLVGEQPWISIHGLDRAALRKGSAAASRGLILRSWRARLGGKDGVAPHFSTYGNEWGKGNFKTVIELSPPPDLTGLVPGDFVEAEIELVVFPGDAKSYYGPNEPFRAALADGADTWRLVHREAAGNALRVNASRGTVRRNFPLQLAVDRSNQAEAVVNGGVGWLPVTFTGLTTHRDFELRVNGRPFGQSVHGNDCWQTDYDPQTGAWSQTFNLPRGDREPLRLQFGLKTEAARASGGPANTNQNPP